jgi:hypothetical protein
LKDERVCECCGLQCDECGCDCCCQEMVSASLNPGRGNSRPSIHPTS